MSDQHVVWKGGQSAAPLPPWMKRPQMPGGSSHITGQDLIFFLDSYLEVGPIFRYSRINQEFTVIAGPEANQFVAREGAHYLSAREFRQESDEAFGVKKNLVSLGGEEHYNFRKLVKQGYSRSSLDGRYAELIGITQGIAGQWRPGQRILVKEVMPRVIAEQLGAGVLNYPVGDYLDDILLFVRTIVVETLARTRPKNVIYSPEFKRAKARAEELADKVIEAHRGGPAGGRGPDLVDDLLAALDADKELLSEQDLRIAVLGGYIGGLDTVAYTCTFMLYALLKHPDVLARVTAEVDAAFAAGPLTPKGLGEMESLHHAALETLRMYPVAAAVQSTVANPFEFAGYRVDRGQNLIIATTVPHYTPEFFPDPERFDIERYGKQRGEHRRPGVFAPFGVGEHICLGAGMAEVLIMLTMAALLRAVRLEMDPPDYELALEYTPTPTPKDFYVRAVEQRS